MKRSLRFDDIRPAAPQHRKVPSRVEKFGLKRHDDYAWMKPGNWQSVLRDPTSLAPEIKNVIGLENTHAEEILFSKEALILDLRRELSAIETSATREVGVAAGKSFYFERISEAGELVLGRRSLMDQSEDILLDMASERDLNPAARLSWGGPKYSFNRARLGWAVDNAGSGVFSIKVRDVGTRALVVEDIKAGHGGFAFDRSGRFLYWVGRDEVGRANCIWRRDTSDGSDAKCFENQDTSYFLDVRS
ncbi:MAG: hypothetical protein AAFZ74_17090 [Pseudomonadota bacterium]